MITAVQQRLALKNILVATDFSTVSNHALDYAVSFAHRYNSNLYITHVLAANGDDSALLDRNKAPLVDQKKQARYKLQKLADHSRHARIPTEVLLAEGCVGTSIHDLVLRH